MTDTPMTDAYIGEGNDDNMTEGEIAMCEFTRQLERERNELLEALEMLMPQCPQRGECDEYDRAMWDNAQAAIAKAKGASHE